MCEKIKETVEVNYSFLFHFKGKMPLCKVAERDNDACSKDFSNSWINMKLLYKKFYKDVIQEYTNHYQHKIPE